MVTLGRKSRSRGTESLVECHRLIANQRHIPATPKKATLLNGSLLIVRSILCDTLKVQRYDSFLTYKEIMSKFIKNKEYWCPIAPCMVYRVITR